MAEGAVRRITTAEYRRMPWRNGGGTTTELVLAPESSGERFLYRVSIADVASDGPFSRFDGYDRHILLLSGAGMTLECGAHGRIELRKPLEPHRFSGDWDVVGTLVNGPVRDFNLMLDRTRARATLEALSVEAARSFALAPGNVCIVHVVAGDLAEAREGETLVAAAAPFRLVPRGVAPVQILVALVTPLVTPSAGC